MIPTILDITNLYTGTKSDLLACFKAFDIIRNERPSSDVMTVDGLVMRNFLVPQKDSQKTSTIFGLSRCSLKQHEKGMRGIGGGMNKVQDSARLSKDRCSFLRNDNKTLLVKF